MISTQTLPQIVKIQKQHLSAMQQESTHQET